MPLELLQGTPIMNTPSGQSPEQEVRQRIIDLLRLAAREVVKRLRAEKKLDSTPRSDR
jgi:hypothetical protein